MAAGDVKVIQTLNRSFKGALFDGINDKMTMTEIPLYNDYTLTFWIKPDNITANMSVIGKLVNTTPSIWITGGKLGILKYGTGTYTFTGGSLTANRWQMITITYNSTTKMAYSYINAVADGSKDCTALGFTTGYNIIGGGAAAIWLAGSLCNLRVYKKMLSSTEMNNLLIGIKPERTDLIAEYKLSEGYNDTSDYVRNLTNDGTFLIDIDDAIAIAVKAQRVASTDKWMCYKALNGYLGTVNIE